MRETPAVHMKGNNTLRSHMFPPDVKFLFTKYQTAANGRYYPSGRGRFVCTAVILEFVPMKRGLCRCTEGEVLFPPALNSYPLRGHESMLPDRKRAGSGDSET